MRWYKMELQRTKAGEWRTKLKEVEEDEESWPPEDGWAGTPKAAGLILLEHLRDVVRQSHEIIKETWEAADAVKAAMLQQSE
jgi:hypothetical protein